MSIHQRKSYKMHIPDSKKCAYVKSAHTKKKMCALVANYTKGD